MTPLKIAYPTPSQSWDKIEEWSLEQRCGMTDTETFFSDQRYLFFHNIYCEDQPGRENMTSFAVKRDIFKSFFPEFDGDSSMDQQLQHDDAILPSSSKPANPLAAIWIFRVFHHVKCHVFPFQGVPDIFMRIRLNQSPRPGR